jgi:ribosomal protein S18 acetylase RimI-like enzyme
VLTRRLALFNARMELPDGLTAAPYTFDDLDAVFAVAAAQQQHDIGRVDVESADFEADWQRPSFDFRTMTTGVYDGDRLVAFGELIGANRGEAGVLPEYRRRGIGTALARWMEGAAKEHGYTAIGGPVPQGSDGDRLLERLGYRVRWTSWVLQLPEGANVPHRELPPGYAIRAATPDDYEAVWNVVEDAFLEWSVREREPYEDFLAVTVRRPGHEPWMLRVVTDPAGEVVGTAMLVMAGDPVTEGYIERLAVRKDQRGQGLAQALLVDAFEQGRQHGAPRSGLSTDSRTGALSLYEKVGMVVVDTWVNRGLDL